MKRNVLIAVLALFGAMAVFSQERIAVFPFEDMDNLLTRTEAFFFYRQFSNEFSNRSSGRFRVIPRSDVDKLINTEAAFQLSEFSAREKTAEMNRVLNGTQILSGIIGKVGNRITISVSLYTYPDLSQLSGGVDLRVADKDELFDKIPELVRDMLKEIAASDPKPPAVQAPRRTYKIGDTGPGGGIVFSVNGDWYTECSGELGRYDSQWRAKEVASNYRGGGFTNWQLPTTNELDQMYVNLKLKKLGGFSNTWYFSYSGGYDFICLHFGNGDKKDGFLLTARVRAVRRFLAEER